MPFMPCVCPVQDADQHLMEDFPPHLHDDDEQQQQQQEMMSNDEAHDQLGDLPFNGGETSWRSMGWGGARISG